MIHFKMIDHDLPILNMANGWILNARWMTIMFRKISESGSARHQLLDGGTLTSATGRTKTEDPELVHGECLGD